MTVTDDKNCGVAAMESEPELESEVEVEVGPEPESQSDVELRLFGHMARKLSLTHSREMAEAFWDVLITEQLSRCTTLEQYARIENAYADLMRSWPELPSAPLLPPSSGAIFHPYNPNSFRSSMQNPAPPSMYNFAPPSMQNPAPRANGYRLEFFDIRGAKNVYWDLNGSESLSFFAERASCVCGDWHSLWEWFGYDEILDPSMTIDMIVRRFKMQEGQRIGPLYCWIPNPPESVKDINPRTKLLTLVYPWRRQLLAITDSHDENASHSVDKEFLRLKGCWRRQSDGKIVRMDTILNNGDVLYAEFRDPDGFVPKLPSLRHGAS